MLIKITQYKKDILIASSISRSSWFNFSTLLFILLVFLYVKSLILHKIFLLQHDFVTSYTEKIKTHTLKKNSYAYLENSIFPS